MSHTDTHRQRSGRFWFVASALMFLGSCQSLPVFTQPTLTLSGRITGAQGPIQLSCNAITLPATQQNAFICPGPVYEGEPFTLRIVAKPLGQSCVVSPSTGVVFASSPNSILVSCTGDRLPALSLNVSGLDPNATLTIQVDGAAHDITQNGPVTLVEDSNVGTVIALALPLQPRALTCAMDTTQFTVVDPPVPQALTCVHALRFVSGQTADVVLGHPPGLADYSQPSQINVPTPGGSMRTLNIQGQSTLLIPDRLQNRVIGMNDFQTGSQASLVWGQNGNFYTNSSGGTPNGFDMPMTVRGDDNYVVITHFDAHVVELRPINGAQETRTAGWVGTSHQPGCSPTTLNNPRSAHLVGGLLYVADSYNNRIAVWRQDDLIPYGMPLALVLGQQDAFTCTDNGPAAGLSTPWDVWSDGNQLVVADTQNHRVLVYDPLPTTISNPAPSYVIGQPTFDTNNTNSNACGVGLLAGPVSIVGDGHNLFISDLTLHRVAVYDGIPHANQAMPVTVIGQTDFSGCSSNASSQTVNMVGFNRPWGLAVDGAHLFVSDSSNQRVLVFTSN